MYRSAEDFRKGLAKRYGSSIILDFEQLFRVSYWHLSDIAVKYGFSREYARQIFQRLYNCSLGQIRGERRGKRRIGLQIKPQCSPMLKLELYHKDSLARVGAVVEALVVEKCEELGYVWKYEPHGRVIDFEINNHLVEVKSARAAVCRPKSGLRYFCCYLNRDQRGADYVIFYVYPKKVFYVFPVNSRRYSWSIREEEPKIYSVPSTYYDEYREAWHLLKK